MSGFTPLPPLPVDASRHDESATHAGPAELLDRPAPPISIRERVDTLVTRIPISPRRLLLLVVAGVAAVAAAVWLLRPPPPAVETTLPRASPAAVVRPATPVSSAPPSSALRRSVIVDAAGSVARPGLYRLSPGARVNDLIRVAGGLRAGADPDRLNLAAPLADGQRLYVPKLGELVAPLPVDPTGSSGGTGPTSTPGPTASGSGTVDATPASPIDLNAASAQELDTLPGVGPSTAASIVDYRAQHGPFRSVDDLLDVRGIGDAKLAALRAKVRV